MKTFLILFFCAAVISPLSTEAATPFVSRIHFLSNRFEIPETEQSQIDQNVEWLKENPSAVLILEGHCDEWGDDYYNLELGDKRAREVKATLIEKGIDPERIIMVVSYGKAKPIDPRSTQEAWVLNRRVEFILR